MTACGSQGAWAAAVREHGQLQREVGAHAQKPSPLAVTTSVYVHPEPGNKVLSATQVPTAQALRGVQPGFVLSKKQPPVPAGSPSAALTLGSATQLSVVQVKPSLQTGFGVLAAATFLVVQLQIPRVAMQCRPQCSSRLTHQPFLNN